MRIALLLAVLLPATTCVTCVKNYYPDPKPADVAPTPTPVVVPIVHTVEFRVIGTAPSAIVSYGSAQEGTTEVTTLTPWSSSFTTSRTTLFVYCSAIAQTLGTVRVQIFVDAVLFREASTDGTIGSIASASGTLQLSPTTTAASAQRDLGDHPELIPPDAVLHPH